MDEIKTINGKINVGGYSLYVFIHADNPEIVINAIKEFIRVEK
ncbi:MAG: hypothetical protein K0S41_2382 [Anaerocolumna sp.]|jgi:hypothetical protein|nr:hypothetical protein [Anaerocolumna sp.]